MRKRPAAAAPDRRVKRLAARAGKGSLQDRRVGPRTLRLYREHAAAFFRWCRAQGYPLPSTCVDFDEVLCVYAGAWRLHSAWGKCEPPERTPPLTKVMVQAIVGHYVAAACPRPPPASSLATTAC